MPHALTFRDWIRNGGPRAVREADLQYHLTTLFPPVRPRGHLELRVIDAQRTDSDWAAALAFITALVSDPSAADAALGALERLSTDPAAILRAARDGLSDPVLAEVAVSCFDAASGALYRTGCGPLGPELAAFIERYVERGRCPADDTLAELTDASFAAARGAVCSA